MGLLHPEPTGAPPSGSYRGAPPSGSSPPPGSVPSRSSAPSLASSALYFTAPLRPRYEHPTILESVPHEHSSSHDRHRHSPSAFLSRPHDCHRHSPLAFLSLLSRRSNLLNGWRPRWWFALSRCSFGLHSLLPSRDDSGAPRYGCRPGGQAERDPAAARGLHG